MSGETERDVSGWTTDTLKMWADQRFADQEKAVQAALAAAEKAVDKAEKAAEKRLDAQNEFRAQLADQAATFVRHDVADARFKSLTDRITALENMSAGMAGRLAGMLAGATLLITVVVFIANYAAR